MAYENHINRANKESGNRTHDDGFEDHYFTIKLFPLFEENWSDQQRKSFKKTNKTV